jgi:alpha-L-fucosidase
LKKIITILLLGNFLICCFFSCSSQKKYQATWESLQTHPTPEWFRDAKFGIYFHWGPYSVPAYKTEWYSHWMYVEGHDINRYHLEKYGPLNEFGYKDFIPLFTGEKFNADEWVDLFVKSGARFAGPVAEHADGFAMWDSKLTKWDAMDMGLKHDIVGEMEKAVRKRGLKFLTTFHHQWLYAWYPTLDKNTDASNPEYQDLYGPPAPVEHFRAVWNDTTIRPDAQFNARWYIRVTEVVNKYHPDLVYFDSKLFIIQEQVRMNFLQHFYNTAATRGSEVVCTYKQKDMAQGAALLDIERGRMSDKSEFPWLTDDSIDWGSWCHVQEPDYKSTDRLIDFLVDVVSKNGCLLLNIPPTAEGEIPQPVKERLLEMGQWLSINGEAIYETRPWKIYGEGPTQVVEGHLKERENADNVAEDIRFTQKGESLYAITLALPEKSLNIRSLGRTTGLLEKEIQSVRLLGHPEPLTWSRNDHGLVIDLPEKKPCEYALAFEIRLGLLF